MADPDELKRPAKSADDKPKAKATKVEQTTEEEKLPEGAVVPEAPSASADETAPAAPAPVAESAEPAAKAVKKSTKQKKDEVAVEAPKENLSLNPDDVERPKIVKAKGS